MAQGVIALGHETCQITRQIETIVDSISRRATDQFPTTCDPVDKQLLPTGPRIGLTVTRTHAFCPQITSHLTCEETQILGSHLLAKTGLLLRDMDRVITEYRQTHDSHSPRLIKRGAVQVHGSTLTCSLDYSIRHHEMFDKVPILCQTYQQSVGKVTDLRLGKEIGLELTIVV